MPLNPRHLFQYSPAAWLLAALLTVLCQTGAQAAGLGAMNVQSKLGQPFAAEIELINIGKEDLATLKVGIAPPSAYDAANLRFDSVLNGLRLSVERRANGVPFIRAVSTRRVTEPYLDVLVELNSPEVKLRRAYTALLDFADTPAPTPSAEAAAPATVPKADASVPPRAAARPRPARSATDGAGVPPPPPPVQAPPVAAARAPVPPPPGKSVPAVLDSKPAVTAKADAAKPEAPKPDAAKPPVVAAAPAAQKPPAEEPAKAEPSKAAETAAETPAKAEAANADAAKGKPPVPEAAKPPADTAKAVPPPKAATPQPAPAATDALDGQMTWLVAALLALLAAVAGVWAWRRRQPPAPDSTAPEVAATEPTIHAPAPTPQAAEDSMLATPVRLRKPANIAPEPPPFEPMVASVTDSVDPLDEAKVHLEYGQSDRAEVILREALNKQPGREDLQLQLLEILAGRGDTDGFNQLAGRVHKQTGGLGEHWKKVMAMGYSLDPSYALYSPPEEAGNRRATDVVLPLDVPGGAADLPLDEPAPSIDMDKTLVLPRSVAAPAAPAELLPDINFELPAASAPTPPAAIEAAVTETTAPVDHSPLEFKVDLPGINPNLAVTTETPDTPNTPEAAPTADSQWEEVQKKIMLARAYREMGDKEGALELLHEVEREGDSAQLEEMREILQTLQ